VKRRLPFDWRRVIVYTHRWLGIAGSLLFVAWFLSGIVMMYARMPELTSQERLARLPPLDLSTARVSPADIAERLTRVNRWFYHGFHNLDFPFLYYRRPLLDIVVMVLSLGGLALSMTTMVPAWRRLRRHGRRFGLFSARRLH
jgi:hypothetical protein